MDLLALYDHRPAAAESNLLRLLTSPRVDKMTKHDIGEAIVSQPRLFHAREVHLTSEQLERRGEVKAARRIALGALRERLGGPPPKEIQAALRACPNRTTLEEVTRLVVSVRRKDSLVRQVRELLTS